MVSLLIDRFGRPLRESTAIARAATAKELSSEDAVPTLTGVRSIWHEPVATGLTPHRLARVLRESAMPGADASDYLTLAEEMEEREPQYRMALTQRKLTLRNIEPVIEPASEDAGDVAIGEEVRKLVDTTTMRNTIVDLADAIPKGYAVSEIVWSTTSSTWKPVKIIDRDQRHFQFDRLTGRRLLLREDGNPDGLELPDAKYLIHVPKLKSGLPIRQGLARPAMWIFMLKSFTLKDWMAFLEVYGMPFRVGKYHSGATEDDKRALLRAVAHVAADGGAIIPEGMLLEFVETKAAASGENAFHGMAGYLDDQFAKLINGQTMTSQDGSSLAQAEVHNEIRLELKRADADDLAATIQRDLIEPYVRFNHGEPANGFPKLTMPVADPEDLEQLMKATESFVGLGGKVPAGPVREKLGWRDPKGGEEVLERQAPAPEEDAEPPIGANRRGKSPEKGTPEKAMARGSRHEHRHLAMIAEDDITQGFGEAMAEDWEPQLDPIMKALRTAFETASGYDDLVARLARLSGTIDLSELTNRLAAASFVSRIMARDAKVDVSADDA